MSFYQDKPDDALRFGDVVRGFPLSAAHIDQPADTGALAEFQIDVAQPDFGVVMTPCCSIGDKTLLLTPLLQVRSTFYKNLYLAENLLRVNWPMTPEQSVPPTEWERMTASDRDRRFDMSKRESLAFVDLFVYAAHDLLPRYTIHLRDGQRETGFYMVDFRRTCHVRCDKVANAKQAPLNTKRLQLSVSARGDLRDKVAAFYARVPREDEV